MKILQYLGVIVLLIGAGVLVFWYAGTGQSNVGLLLGLDTGLGLCSPHFP